MKRFYCTICKKIKRVRRLPLVISQQNSPLVDERVGECNRHSVVYYRPARRASHAKADTTSPNYGAQKAAQAKTGKTSDKKGSK